MALGYHEDHDARTIEIDVAGRITREDFDAIAPKVEQFANDHGPIKVLEVVRHLDGVEPGLIWDGLRLDFRVVPHITHCAVVGDAAWLSPLTRAASVVMPIAMRCFPMAEMDAARTWLTEADAGVERGA